MDKMKVLKPHVRSIIDRTEYRMKIGLSFTPAIGDKRVSDLIKENSPRLADEAQLNVIKDIMQVFDSESLIQEIEQEPAEA